MATRLIILIVLLAALGGCAAVEGPALPGNGPCGADGGEGTTCNVIEGFAGNSVSPGAVGATISGGGEFTFPNRVTGDFGAIGGGVDNQAGERATVGGGAHNTASGLRAAIGGGSRNTASRDHATVAGGANNSASASRATVGGGAHNSASAVDATVGGGSGNIASFTHATVGGGTRNSATNFDATVGGGGGNTAGGAYATVGGGASNVARGFNATIAGGSGNVAGSENATIGGGVGNHVTDDYSTVGGGLGNRAGNSNGDSKDARYSSVGGGLDNRASGVGASVGGGGNNTAGGSFATVPGGSSSSAAGDYSLAAGRRAIVDAAHDGTFLYADSSNFDFHSRAANEFAVRATGGVRLITAIDASGTPSAGVRLAQGSGSWESLSDRDAKANFEAVDGRAILERLASVPINRWSYKSQGPSIRHIGPTAQDFSAAFGLGADERYISTVDADGIALAAIQGLYQAVQEQDARIGAQQEQITALRAERAAHQEYVARLEERVAVLEQAIEGRTAGPQPQAPSARGRWILFGGLALAGAMLVRRPGATVPRRLVVFFVATVLALLLGCGQPTSPTHPTGISTTEIESPVATASAPSDTPGAGAPPSSSTTLAAGPVRAGASPTAESSPFPYTTPLPPSVATILDGKYQKVDPKEATPTPCRRCPDWKPEGGQWILRFERGVFRVAHTVTGWRTVGSFTVSGDRLFLFNDPTCHEDLGVYRWGFADGALTLMLVDDPCAIGLRARNLTAMPWTSCQPPNTEAATSDHWPTPAGC